MNEGSAAGNPRTFDVAVIGAGAVGLATAMALAVDHGRSVVVVEAEERVAAHQTGHNSGVIHSGLYYKPGSLKATLCAAGRDAMYRFCQDHGIPHERCGKVVVATGDAQLPALDELERRGRANGLAGLRRLSPGQVRELEPHAATAVAGLHVPETGITDYRRVAAAYVEVVRNAGGEVRPGWTFLGARPDGPGLIVRTTRGELSVRALVNCGGLHSDRVAARCGLAPAVRIIPFRGEYYTLAPAAHGLVRNLIYPVPDPRFPFLGVHLTRMIEGGVEAGPNAVLALARHGYTRAAFRLGDACLTALYPGFWRMARRHWRTGGSEIYRSLSKRAFLRSLQQLVPDLTLDDLTPGGAGVRAQAVLSDGSLADDFRIQPADRQVHVLNAPSPAATASIAIGRHIAALATRL